MTKEWMEVKAEIERLYLTQRLQLEAVQRIMLEQHGFDASIRSYKKKFKEWEWNTYRKSCITVPCTTVQRISRNRPPPKALGKATSVRAEIKFLQQEIERQKGIVVHERNAVLVACQAAGVEQPDSTAAQTIVESVDKITRIEDTLVELRRYMQRILQFVTSQTGGPTGFASWWRIEPMKLEDALGNCILIPLEAVVSWEVFEKVLEVHFEQLSGARKVQRREYTIEDCLTKARFCRDKPWLSFSKPGLKIEMSMVFRDKSKTSVVCPNCDTISKEKKGTLIKCKNPECKMLFRTEDDEDEVLQSPHQNFRKVKPLFGSLGMKPGAGNEKDEDEPGSFKRVTIRIAREPPAGQSTASLKDEWINIGLPPNFYRTNAFTFYDSEDPWNDPWNDAYPDSDFNDVNSADSYYALLEDNFMKDFLCCGKTIPTLHDLLQHYEESHPQEKPGFTGTASAAQRARETSTPDTKAAIAAQAVTAILEQS